MNNFIKLDDLYDAQARRNREKEKLYEDFLTACTNKIKKCASAFTSNTVACTKYHHLKLDTHNTMLWI